MNQGARLMYLHGFGFPGVAYHVYYRTCAPVETYGQVPTVPAFATIPEAPRNASSPTVCVGKDNIVDATHNGASRFSTADEVNHYYNFDRPRSLPGRRRIEGWYKVEEECKAVCLGTFEYRKPA